MDQGADMNISYEHYRVFYWVARCQSMSAASKKLNANQPNVTRIIRLLEQNLGCQLFIRSSRGVRLTPEGEILYRRVKIAVENIQAAEEELARSRTLQEGVVTLAASDVALHCRLLPVLKKYREAYPNIRIRVFNSSSPQAIETLRNALADLAVATMPEVLPDDLNAKTVGEIEDIPVCSNAFAFLKGRVLSLKELSEHPLVGLESATATSSYYSSFFARHGLPFQPEIEAASADQILPMVRSGLGIGFLPESFAREDLDNGSVFRVLLDCAIPKRKICLLTPKNRAQSPAARELERMIAQSAA